MLQQVFSSSSGSHVVIFLCMQLYAYVLSCGQMLNTQSYTEREILEVRVFPLYRGVNLLFSFACFQACFIRSK